jgi:hypothetical protein
MIFMYSCMMIRKGDGREASLVSGNDYIETNEDAFSVCTCVSFGITSVFL